MVEMLKTGYRFGDCALAKPLVVGVAVSLSVALSALPARASEDPSPDDDAMPMSAEEGEVVPPHDDHDSTETDDGGTKARIGDFLWSYSLQGETAVITGVSPAIGEIAIPSNIVVDGVGHDVKVVGTGAFRDCDGLVSVEIPPGVEKIGNYAFMNCPALNKVTIRGEVRVLGFKAFANCESLRKVVFCEDLPKSAAQNCFEGVCPSCTGYVSTDFADQHPDIPGTWNGIDVVLSDSPSAANAASVPEVARKPRPRVFSCEIQGCRFKYTLDAHGNATLMGGDDTACVSPMPTGVVTIPAKVDGHRVVAIGHRAFYGCKDMIGLKIPEGIEAIRGGQSFYGCRKLKEVRLPKSVKTIGSRCFEGCTGLEGIDFANCERAADGFGGALVRCTNLKRIAAAASNRNVVSVDGVLYSRDRKTLMAYPKSRESLSLISGVTRIARSALASCRMKNVRIPEGVQAVGDRAFECSDGVLSSVEFPKSLQALGGMVFNGTHSIARVVFHGDAPQSGMKVFEGCDSAFAVEVERGSKGWGGPDSDELPESWPVGADGAARPLRQKQDSGR